MTLALAGSFGGVFLHSTVTGFAAAPGASNCARSPAARCSVAMWDNRFTLHLPVNDAAAERRVMIRATALAGPVR